ncbi:MAG: hypothetical protein ABR529_06475 [Actinomycetota bacterium]
MNPTNGVLSEGRQMYQQHWRHLLPISFIVYGGVAVVSALLGAALGWVGAIIAALLSIVALFWVQGALVAAVDDIRDGRADLSVGDTFRRVRPRIGPIALASILAGLGIGIGLLLLIIPGLILMTIWVVITPAIVLENAGTLDSFGRSRELVRGHGMSVFGVIVLTFLILLAFGIVLSVLMAPLPSGVQEFVSNIVSGGLTAPFIALTWTILYYRLRDARGDATSLGAA